MKRKFIIVAGLFICLGTAAWIAVRLVSDQPRLQPLPSAQADSGESSSHELARRGRTVLTHAEIDRLLAGACEAVQKPDQLPNPVKNAFAVITDERPFSLAAPGDRFNATDVLEPGLPARRLVLGGHCDDRWFIEYEHGGITRSIGLVVFKLNADRSVALLWGRALKQPAPSVDQLRVALSNNAYWDAPYYW